MIKALFIDFDGTLFSHNIHQIPDSALNAIKQVREKGILVFLCTGRAKSEFKQFDLSMVEVDGMVLCNGQVVFDKDGNIIYENPISGELRERLLDIFSNRKLPIYFASNEDLFVNYVNDTIIKVQADVSSNVPKIKAYEGESFYMASAFYDNDEELEFLNSLKDIAEVTGWHNGAVDIVPKGSCKSAGIKETIKRLGIRVEETMSFGDGDNDVDMLKGCGIGVAMGNAPDFVKEAADYVTDDIDEDGLHNALRHYGII